MTTTEDVRKKYDKLYDDLKEFYKCLGNKELSLQMIVTLTRWCMEHVQTNKEWIKMKGSEKKLLVVGVMTEFLNDALNDAKALNEDTKAKLSIALEMLPSIIDATIDFAKTYRITKPYEVFKSKKWCCY